MVDENKEPITKSGIFIDFGEPGNVMANVNYIGTVYPAQILSIVKQMELIAGNEYLSRYLERLMAREQQQKLTVPESKILLAGKDG